MHGCCCAICSASRTPPPGWTPVSAGSGALAGTTYPLDRQFTAEKLGFAAPCPNSLDGVSDRDFCIELANAISICMMHLSRLSEEIILWCSWEFKFIELDDAFTTGSSIMPQKKNPDVTELIRGKTGRVYGDLNTLLVMMKGIPLAYNKDMQEDKELSFDAIDTVTGKLQLVEQAYRTGDKDHQLDGCRVTRWMRAPFRWRISRRQVSARWQRSCAGSSESAASKS